MSTGVLLGILGAVVVAIIIVVVMRRRSVGPAEPPAAELREPEPAPPSEPAEEPVAEEPPEEEEPAAEKPSEEEEPAAAEPAEEPAAPAAEPEPEREPEPAPAEEAAPAAPGVRLDEKAEEDAAAQLKAARRERRLQRLRKGLAPTRGGFIAKIGDLFKGKKEIDDGLIEELEETLITADVGVNTTEWFINLIREALDRDELSDADKVWDLLRQEVGQALSMDAPPMDFAAAKPYVVMVVGVNGVGKTTTIGKLATTLAEQDKKVVLAAADTFRAAAVNQLQIWGRRSGAEVVKGKAGADPSSVVFDAIKRAQEIDADVVIADTAGRLHTKVPLMDELAKIHRVCGKALDGAPHQSLLVLDATTGQNAMQQVAMFKEALTLDGLVLTKLDGTAKGGVIIGICHEHELPVRYIGIGEAKDDLRPFIVEDFVDALFLREDGEDSD